MEAFKSKEEILEEMGLNIRRLMTGLLLEVNIFASLCSTMQHYAGETI